MQINQAVRRLFVHLAYLDDSDTKCKGGRWKVIAAVVLPDVIFPSLEWMMGAIAENLVPPEKLSQFEEFHACELYKGYGIFEGIEQPKRFRAIDDLLELVHTEGVAVGYGAVDTTHLEQQVYGDVDPIVMSFRLCIEELDNWMDSQFPFDPEGPEQTALVIVDDCDGKTKAALQKSFRTMRKPKFGPKYGFETVHRLHDDMYFGASRYSIGIQLADLCAYFIARHLEEGEISEIAGFYKRICDTVRFSRTEPNQKVTMPKAKETYK